ncbi:hypothetical protein LI82_00065 [Methanococcoides methylutens]|uniref:NadR/Ttd14 AAA domain-containing protein n=1 Tax=Methanococcoides methylutens TaxID=2226 RepID=A0A099T6A3_METMT|nr:AAA family ATPase [Methanococcoides methylutens]KGK99658.1 hypothetical protein LI82_00065 [Methanococcoides methylutens]
MTGTNPVSSFSGSSQDDLNSLRRICFTGVRGVGKSTVLEEIDKQSINMCFASGSGMLQDIMGEAYAHFEFLPENEKYAYRLEIREKLQRIQEIHKRDLLIDSHLTVYNLKTGDIDVIFTHMDYKFYTDIILLDSYPERIQDHRQRDTKKKRVTDLEIIRWELDFERQKAAEIAKKYGIRFNVVEMGEGATQNLERILVKLQ